MVCAIWLGIICSLRSRDLSLLIEAIASAAVMAAH